MSGRTKGRQTAVNVAYDTQAERRAARRTWLIVVCVVVAVALVVLVSVLVARRASAASAAAGPDGTFVAENVQTAQARPSKATHSAKEKAPAKHGKDTKPASKPSAKDTTHAASTHRPPPPPPTCPAGSTPAPAASGPGKCTQGRASLGFCTMDIGTVPLTCVRENAWHVNKSAANDTFDNVAVCDIDPPNPGTIRPEVEFIIDWTYSRSGALLVGGGHVRITNGGECTTTLSSLLLLLERSGIPPGTGDSVGPSGKNHKLISTVGIESDAVNAGCHDDGGAHICDTTTSIPCDTLVPYEANGLSTPTPLDEISIPTTSCMAPVEIPVDFIFPLDESDVAIIQADHTGYRINVLATFNTCCDRGSACGINIDCDAHGTIENVRTVQVRSPSFDVDIDHCQVRCACMPDIVDTMTSQGSNGCGDDPVQLVIPITGPCQNQTNNHYRYVGAGGDTACCDATVPYGCNLKSIDILNSISVQTTPECTGLLTGESLVVIENAVANTTLNCECIKEECPSPMVLGTPCVFPDRCGGSTNCTDACAHVNGTCESGTCECKDECGSGVENDPCGTQVFCGVSTECECSQGYTCGGDNKCHPIVCETCDRFECVPPNNNVLMDTCTNTPCPQQDCPPGSCTTCSSDGRCVPDPSCVPSTVPYCTWTLGRWKQTCAGPKNLATCEPDALVTPNTTKPDCVDASCYADLCLASGNGSVFRLGDDNGAYIDFNPCLEDITVSTWGDLAALVRSFVSIHTGPSSWIGGNIPTGNLWHSIPTPDAPTDLGTLGAQLVTVMANRALLNQTNGSTVTLDNTHVNVSCLLGVPNTAASNYSVDMILALANCFVAYDPATVTSFSDMCSQCFGSQSANDPANLVGCLAFPTAAQMVAPDYSPMIHILDDINHYTDNCITNTTLAPCFSVS